MSSDPLATVTLRDEDAALEATFVPGAGMLCCSLRHRGEELLASNEGVSAYAQRGKTMGIPLLYPWANRLAGFDYTVAGHTVAIPRDPARIALDANGLPIHGVIGGRQAWELGDQPGSDARSLCARLTWSERRPELFEVFPFRHDLHYTARLLDGRLEIAVTLDACGRDPVPVAFGFHPYLVPGHEAREHWQVELPAMRRLALDSRQIPIGAERSLAPQRFELAAHAFDDGFDSLAEPSSFGVTAGPRRIEMQFAEGYPCAQVYTPAGAQFICFEPMTAPANALRSGERLPVLAPGTRRTMRFTLAVRALS